MNRKQAVQSLPTHPVISSRDSGLLPKKTLDSKSLVYVAERETDIQPHQPYQEQVWQHLTQIPLL